MRVNSVLHLLIATVLAGAASVTHAEDAACREATRRGLALVTKAATNWQSHKTCFSCHHQTLPMLAVTEAARAGFPLDRAWLESQADTTHKYFEQRITSMDHGDHVPGGATTAGYGLWALSMASLPADTTTTSVITYLAKIQGVVRLADHGPADLSVIENGRWTTSCRRPPLQGSDVGDTVLTLIGMDKYSTEAQRLQLAPARAAAEKWLAQAKLLTQEDRVWRLWGLHHLHGDTSLVESTRAAIAAAQQADGGWNASGKLDSDAFSTAETLFVLAQTDTPLSDPQIQRAKEYLLRAQLADGSWLVKSRVKYKAQPYFENGDPHGEHQFLSTAATAWATAALSQLLDRN